MLVDIRLWFQRISLSRHDPTPVELGINVGEELPPESAEVRMGPGPRMQACEMDRIGSAEARGIGRDGRGIGVGSWIR